MPGLTGERHAAFILPPDDRLADQQRVSRYPGALVIDVPRHPPDPDVSVVVVLALDGRITSDERPAQGADGTVTLGATYATVDSDDTPGGASLRYEPERDCVGYWRSTGDTLRWTFHVREPGRFRVRFEQSAVADCDGGRYAVRVGDQEVEGRVSVTGDWSRFTECEAEGTLALAEPGQYRLDVVPLDKPGRSLVNIRAVRLIPVR